MGNCFGKHAARACHNRRNAVAPGSCQGCNCTYTTSIRLPIDPSHNTSMYSRSSGPLNIRSDCYAVRSIQDGYSPTFTGPTWHEVAGSLLPATPSAFHQCRRNSCHASSAGRRESLASHGQGSYGPGYDFQSVSASYGYGPSEFDYAVGSGIASEKSGQSLQSQASKPPRMCNRPSNLDKMRERYRAFEDVSTTQRRDTKIAHSEMARSGNSGLMQRAVLENGMAASTISHRPNSPMVALSTRSGHSAKFANSAFFPRSETMFASPGVSPSGSIRRPMTFSRSGTGNSLAPTFNRSNTANSARFSSTPPLHSPAAPPPKPPPRFFQASGTASTAASLEDLASNYLEGVDKRKGFVRSATNDSLGKQIIAFRKSMTQDFHLKTVAEEKAVEKAKMAVVESTTVSPASTQFVYSSEDSKQTNSTHKERSRVTESSIRASSTPLSGGKKAASVVVVKKKRRKQIGKPAALPQAAGF